MKNIKALPAILAVCFFVPFLALASNSRAPEVKIFNNDLVQQKSFYAFPNMNENGGSIAVHDLGKDGKAEIIIGSGPGEEPWVYVYRSDGFLKRKFLAYDINSKMGVNVAVGNVRGKNKKKEIITAPMLGGGPQVRIFNAKGEALYNGTFYAFPEDFTGGVNIAVCQTNGTGHDEIIASAGPGGSPHARSYDSRGNYLGLDYRPFSEDNRGGATVTCANVDGGKEDEIVFGIQSFGVPDVKVYKTDSNRTVVGEWQAYDSNYEGGVQITGADMDNDGDDEIITAPTGDGTSQIRIFEGYGAETKAGSVIYESDFKGGVRIAAGTLESNKKVVSLVALPSKRIIEGRSDLFKYIDVNLSEQRLTAYYDGKKVFDYLISSGLANRPTPPGDFTVYAKFETLHMVGNYGEGNPDNYDLENVPHVLAFYGDYTIHGAYWHHNWGHVMSHGCVNEPLYEAGLLYDWANVGDPVIVHY